MQCRKRSILSLFRLHRKFFCDFLCPDREPATTKFSPRSSLVGIDDMILVNDEPIIFAFFRYFGPFYSLRREN